MNLVIRYQPVRQPLWPWAWHHPHCWALAVAAAAWVAMVPHMLNPGHCLSCMTPGQEVFAWLLMVAAMMFPLLDESIKWLARRNFRTRRDAAIALFLLGYLAVWSVSGVLVVAMHSQPWGAWAGIPFLAFIVGGLWFLTPGWQLAHNQCHAQRPFAVSGWRWLRDVTLLGARRGGACTATCLPLMVGCALTGHAAFAMIGGLGIGLLEHKSFRPPRRLMAGASFALALIWLVTR